MGREPSVPIVPVRAFQVLPKAIKQCAPTRHSPPSTFPSAKSSKQKQVNNRNSKTKISASNRSRLGNKPFVYASDFVYNSDSLTDLSQSRQFACVSTVRFRGRPRRTTDCSSVHSQAQQQQQTTNNFPCQCF